MYQSTKVLILFHASDRDFFLNVSKLLLAPSLSMGTAVSLFNDMTLVELFCPLFFLKLDFPFLVGVLLVASLSVIAIILF